MLLGGDESARETALDQTVWPICHETQDAPVVFVQIVTFFRSKEVAFHLIVWVLYFFVKRYLVFTKKKGFNQCNTKHFLKIKLISLTSELNSDCKYYVLFKKIGNSNLLPGYYWPCGFKLLFYQAVSPSLRCGFVILQVQFTCNWEFCFKIERSKSILDPRILANVD